MNDGVNELLGWRRSSKPPVNILLAIHLSASAPSSLLLPSSLAPCVQRADSLAHGRRHSAAVDAQQSATTKRRALPCCLLPPLPCQHWQLRRGRRPLGRPALPSAAWLPCPRHPTQQRSPTPEALALLTRCRHHQYWMVPPCLFLQPPRQCPHRGGAAVPLPRHPRSSPHPPPRPPLPCPRTQPCLHSSHSSHSHLRTRAASDLACLAQSLRSHSPSPSPSSFLPPRPPHLIPPPPSSAQTHFACSQEQ